MKKLIWILCILIYTFVSAEDIKYTYPLKNRFESTVLGTPSQYFLELPKRIPVKKYSIEIFPNNPVPKIFKYNNKFKFHLTKQEKKAPLIFVIAGAGAGYNSPKVKKFEEIFYKAGYHVIAISSPTYPNFIINASTSHLPGIIEDDSKDIYRAMFKAYERVKRKIDVSEFYLLGYSSGATQAAYVSKIDDEQKLFNFSKVLMINPAVCLYSSALVFDNYLVKKPSWVIRDIVEKIASIYVKNESLGGKDEGINVTGDFFYEFFKAEKLSDYQLTALIGAAFRINAVDLIFVSDIMSDSKVHVKQGWEVSKYKKLTPYLKELINHGFINYFEELLIPNYVEKYGEKDIGAIKAKTGIVQIKDYLEKTEKIAMFTNRDEIILNKNELKFLEETFQDRAKIYPYGGHCGNMFYIENVEDYLKFFNGEGIN